MFNFTLIDGQSKTTIHSSYKPREVAKEVGWWTVDGADFLIGSKTAEGLVIPTEGDEIIYGGGGHNYLNAFTFRECSALFTTGGGGDSLTDAGLGNNSFHQGADVWTNGSATSILQDVLTKGGQEREELASKKWDPAPTCDIGATCMPTCATGFADDALVQQANDFAGLINPDSMRPVEYFSHNPEWFAPGSAVDALGASNPMGIEPNQMMGSISRGDMFAPTSIVIRENAN